MTTSRADRSRTFPRPPRRGRRPILAALAFAAACALGTTAALAEDVPATAPAAPPASAPTAGNPAAGDDAGHAVGQIHLMFTGAMAPCVAHVHACDIRVGHGSPIAARFHWDFGDPGSAHNALDGFNAAHLYDKPGAYPIVLTVTDEAGVATVFRTNVIVDPDKRTTYYVSADGDDQNAGTDPAHPFRTAARAGRALGDNDVALRFRRGDTFRMTSGLTVKGNDVYVGAYGPAAATAPSAPTSAPAAAPAAPVVPSADDSPPPATAPVAAAPPATAPADDGRPVLLWDGHGDNNRMIQGTRTTSDLVVDGLTFDSVYNKNAEKKDTPTGVEPSGRLVSVRDCRFLNLAGAVNCELNPTGVLIQGCDAPSPTGIRGYFVWISARDVCVVGCSCVNSTREHIVRMSGFERVLVEDNVLSNLDRTAVDKADSAKGAVVIQRGSYVTVSHNDIPSGPIGMGPLGGADGMKDKQRDVSRSAFVVVENNRVRKNHIEVRPGVEHAMVRNNLIYPGRSAGFYVAATEKGYPNRGVIDLRLVNNTVVLAGATQGFAAFAGHPQGTIVDGNLLVAPNLVTGQNSSADLFVADRDLSGFAEIRDNVWAVPAEIAGWARGGVCYVSTAGSAAEGFLTPEAWNAQAPVKHDSFRNVRVDDAGVPMDDVTIAAPCPGAHMDLAGHPRPTTGPSFAGAVMPSTRPATP